MCSVAAVAPTIAMSIRLPEPVGHCFAARESDHLRPPPSHCFGYLAVAFFTKALAQTPIGLGLADAASASMLAGLLVLGWFACRRA